MHTCFEQVCYQWGFKSPSDTNRIPTVRGKIYFCPHRLCCRMVGQAEAEVSVDLQLVFGFGVAQGGHHVAELVNDRDDLRFGEVTDLVRRGLGWLGRLLERALALGLGVGDPRRDHGWVSSSVEGRAVAHQFGVAFGDGGTDGGWPSCG
jgi:hypothetical protein